MGNRETVIGIYDAFGRGDVPWILAQLDDDIEWEPGIRDTGIAYWKPGRGKAHVAEFFENLAANLELTHFEPEAICDGGAIISVPVRHAGHIVGGGEVPMQEQVHVWRFGPNGRVIAFNHILDMAVHERAAAARSKGHEGAVFHVVAERVEVLQAGELFEVFSLTGTKDAGPPPHAHPWMESYFGLAGEVEVTIEGQAQVLRCGDFACVPAGALHAFRTLTEDARFLVVTDGHRASAFFADISEHVTPGVPTEETMPLLIEVAQRNGLSSPLFA